MTESEDLEVISSRKWARTLISKCSWKMSLTKPLVLAWLKAIITLWKSRMKLSTTEYSLWRHRPSFGRSMQVRMRREEVMGSLLLKCRFNRLTVTGMRTHRRFSQRPQSHSRAAIQNRVSLVTHSWALVRGNVRLWMSRATAQAAKVTVTASKPTLAFTKNSDSLQS